MSERVKSPCVSICALDADDVCIGCYRTGQEISFWGQMTPAQQRDVMVRVEQREQAAANFMRLPE